MAERSNFEVKNISFSEKKKGEHEFFFSRSNKLGV